MDKTLVEYDKNLEELERQREKLEIVMQMMGQEWEESGAGIGWLGQLDLPVANTHIDDSASPTPSSVSNNTTPSTIHETPLSELTTEPLVETLPLISGTSSHSPNHPHSITHPPLLFSNILSQTTGPSPEYLQSLLNVNEALLAQSLANNTTTHNNNNNSNNSNSKNDTYNTPMLTPSHEITTLDTSRPTRPHSPLITPDNSTSSEENNNTPRDYMGSMNPDSELVISPLETTKKIFSTDTTTNIATI